MRSARDPEVYFGSGAKATLPEGPAGFAATAGKPETGSPREAAAICITISAKVGAGAAAIGFPLRGMAMENS